MLQFEMYCEDFDPDFPARVYFVVFENEEPALVFSTTHNLRDAVKAIDGAKTISDLVDAGYEPTDNWEDDYGDVAVAEEVYNEITSVDAEYYHMVIDRTRHFQFINASKALIEEFLPGHDSRIPKSCYDAEPSVYIRGIGTLGAERVVTALCGKPARIRLCGDLLSLTDLGDAYRKEMVRLSSEHLGGIENVAEFDRAYACLESNIHGLQCPLDCVLSVGELATLIDFYALVHGSELSEKQRDELLRKTAEVHVGAEDMGYLLYDFIRGIPAELLGKE